MTKSAFLNGKSDFAIYMCQPPGFTDVKRRHHVLVLLKSLSCLKQASRIWYVMLYDAIINLSFTARIRPMHLQINERSSHHRSVP